MCNKTVICGYLKIVDYDPGLVQMDNSRILTIGYLQIVAKTSMIVLAEGSN